MTRFDATSETDDLHRPGRAGCDLECLRVDYGIWGRAVANAARAEGNVPDWVIAALVADMSGVGRSIARLQGAAPGGDVPQPTFIDDLMEIWDVSGEQGRRVLGSIIVEELISALFGTAPACGGKKLEDGTPTCIK